MRSGCCSCGRKRGRASANRGPYLFGTFSAADIMYAPVASRFRTYGFKLPGFALAYSEAILGHQWVRDWYEAAEQEDWTLDQYEDIAGAEA